MKEVLNIVLQPTKPPNAVYSSELVQYMLKRQIVSANMVDVGLLRILRIRNDWVSPRCLAQKYPFRSYRIQSSIEQAFSTVLDLPESEILETLAYVVANHRKSRSLSGDAMQVDPPNSTIAGMPSLPQFLSLCVRYSTSAPALRIALRRYLSDADDLQCILEVLDNWILVWKSKEVKLLPSKKALGKNEFGVLTVLNRQEGESDFLPPLNNVGILSFDYARFHAHLLCLLIDHHVSSNSPRCLLRVPRPAHPFPRHSTENLLLY